MYDTVHRAQKFIAGNEKSGGITALAVSPNKRYVAIAEVLDRATVFIFDLSTQRRKKALVANDIISKVYFLTYLASCLTFFVPNILCSHL